MYPPRWLPSASPDEMLSLTKTAASDIVPEATVFSPFFQAHVKSGPRMCLLHYSVPGLPNHFASPFLTAMARSRQSMKGRYSQKLFASGSTSGFSVSPICSSANLRRAMILAYTSG